MRISTSTDQKNERSRGQLPPFLSIQFGSEKITRLPLAGPFKPSHTRLSRHGHRPTTCHHRLHTHSTLRLPHRHETPSCCSRDMAPLAHAASQALCEVACPRDRPGPMQRRAPGLAPRSGASRYWRARAPSTLALLASLPPLASLLFNSPDLEVKSM